MSGESIRLYRENAGEKVHQSFCTYHGVQQRLVYTRAKRQKEGKGKGETSGQFIYALRQGSTDSATMYDDANKGNAKSSRFTWAS